MNLNKKKFADEYKNYFINLLEEYFKDVVANDFFQGIKTVIYSEKKSLNEIVVREFEKLKNAIDNEMSAIKSIISESKNNNINDCLVIGDESEIRYKENENIFFKFKRKNFSPTAPARDHTLGPFEITDNTMEVSGFISYRKSPNANEKCNRPVIQKQERENKRKLTFSKNIFDCKFTVDIN